MRLRDPFGQALKGIRQALATGLAPGQHLAIADIAAGMRLSTTPVREALSRLCGEGLIEDRRGQGYFTRAAPLEDVLGLLDLEEVHVRLAVRLADIAPPDLQGEAIETWISDLFTQCENAPLIESFQRVRSRLDPLRRLQAQPGRPSEFEGDPLGAYYAGWRRVVGAIAASARRQDRGPPEYTTDTV